MGNSYKIKTKNSYYKLLNKAFKKKQDQNYNNIHNINFSFLIKSFSNKYNQEINLAFAAKNISWETFLKKKLLYLSNNYNYLWARNLYLFITKNKFPNQYKYFSLFFYEEFQILSLPKLLNFHPIIHYSNHKKKEEKKNIIINDESSDDDFDNKSTNIKNKNGFKEIIDDIYNKNKIQISNEVMGSFSSISNEENSFTNENDPTLKYKLGKTKLKKYMDIFKNHLCHKDHPINIILNKFYQEFNPFILKTISSCKKILNDKQNIQKCEDIILQLQEFIITLQIVVKLFYSKCISYDDFRDEKDEFSNLISFLVFNTGNIYKNIFEILDIMNYEKIQSFESQIEKYGELNPEEIGVKEKFCLNEITIEYMNKYREKKKTMNNNDNEDNENNQNINKQKIQNKENNNIKIENINDFQNSFNIYYQSLPRLNPIKFLNDNLNDFEGINNELKKNETNKIDINIMNVLNINNEEQKYKDLYSSLINIDENKKDEPYYEAIETLKGIIKFKTPLEKLVIIASIGSFINDSIYKFWKPMENLINLSFLNIEADELMKILVYIAYKSKMSKLFVHLDFIKYFTIKETKTTMIGYYYTLLEGAINYILEINDKMLFLNR